MRYSWSGNLATEPKLNRINYLVKGIFAEHAARFFLGHCGNITQKFLGDFIPKNGKCHLGCREKKNKGGAKLSKGWIFSFSWCLQVLDANVHARNCVPGIIRKQNVYNAFMVRSKHMIAYLHHIKWLATIWSWKIVGIKQEINAIYLKIPRQCVKQKKVHQISRMYLNHKVFGAKAVSYSVLVKGL